MAPGWIGEYISRKLDTATWGEGVVAALAGYIARRYPGLSGFTRANLFRMRQFYDTYRHDEKVAPLVRQIPWSHNLLILSRCKRPEEREFYPRLAHRDRWSRRDLERHLAGTAIQIDPKIFDSYAGQYELRPGFVFTLSREGDKLWAQATNQAPIEIFAESETLFFAKVLDAQLEIVKDASGAVTNLILHQNGRKSPGKKIQ